MTQQIQIDRKAVAVVLAFFAVFFSGYIVGRLEVVQDPSRAISQNTAIINRDKNKPANTDFSLFWDAWKVIDDRYVKKPNDQDRVHGAIAGMVASLGDPYTMFMKPSENERFSQDISGNFEGIGAELVQKDGYITVVAPLDNSPAQRSGLMAGDIIIKIDDKDAPGTLDEGVKLIRGKKGTEVKLTVVRGGKEKEITIVRDTVEVKSVSYSLKDGIAVVKLNQFSANTTEQLDEILKKVSADKPKGLVLDLRNNPGGLLDKAITITSHFIEPGSVVIERDKDGKETVLRTEAVANRVTLPMVVLINKGSASASEILAGAIQDAERAQLVGETSFGKGSVQTIENLKDGSAVRVTIAEWLTPKKREINKVGITPDITVGLSEEDVAAGRDPQLDKALELLK